MENIAIVQPTQQLKSKEQNSSHKMMNRAINSPNKASCSEREYCMNFIRRNRKNVIKD